MIVLPLRTFDAGLRLLPQELHWIEQRRVAQHDMGFTAFWRRFMGGEWPPARLYHAQGAQFGVSASAVRRRPKAWYEMLRAELERGGRDPVLGYYCELVWWFVFDADLAPVAARW